MQIREKGRKIQLIRTEYRPEKKRTFPITVGTYDKYRSAAPIEILDLLTDEEKEQVVKWHDDRKKNDCRETSLLTAGQINLSIMSAAAGFIGDDAQELTESKAKAIYEAMDELTKTMRKLGFSRASIKKSELDK